MDFPRETLMDLHKRMVRIRLFEEAAGRLAEGAKLPGFLHLYVGEEAVASGVCGALTDLDQITSTHRGHGHLVAKGGDFRRMMAELMGKATGYNNGKGGSMHICDLDLGMLGANGIVGAGAPIAVGAAFANKYRGDGKVAVAFFGDGATNIGAFHEAANMACALHLPIVFACENNEAAVEAVARARSGGGPSLIEAKTYRFYNHHGVQNLGLKYRTDDEVEMWKQRDPIFTFESRMIDAGIATAADFEAVWSEWRAAIDDAIAFAEESPLPTIDQITVGVYTARQEPQLAAVAAVEVPA
jgi:acetoin:2,6-dichlorophenolindophenol oxidoreductase subunit alpha